MNDNADTNGISMTSLLASIPLGATILSVVYIYGYSRSTSLPILPFMSLEDFLVAALPWIFPTVVLWGISMIFGTVLARSGAKIQLIESKPKGTLANRIFSSLAFVVLILWLPYFIADLLLGILALKSFILLFFAIYLGVFELAGHTPFVSNWATIFGERGIRVVIMLPFVLLITGIAGYDNGKTGYRFMGGDVICKLEVTGQATPIEARVSFRLSEYLLVHVKTQSGYYPMMIPLKEIVRLEPADREDEAKYLLRNTKVPRVGP